MLQFHSFSYLARNAVAILVVFFPKHDYITPDGERYLHTLLAMLVTINVTEFQS